MIYNVVVALLAAKERGHKCIYKCGFRDVEMFTGFALIKPESARGVNMFTQKWRANMAFFK